MFVIQLYDEVLTWISVWMSGIKFYNEFVLMGIHYGCMWYKSLWNGTFMVLVVRYSNIILYIITVNVFYMLTYKIIKLILTKVK